MQAGNSDLSWKDANKRLAGWVRELGATEAVVSNDQTFTTWFENNTSQIDARISASKSETVASSLKQLLASNEQGYPSTPLALFLFTLAALPFQKQNSMELFRYFGGFLFC